MGRIYIYIYILLYPARGSFFSWVFMHNLGIYTYIYIALADIYGSGSGVGVTRVREKMKVEPSKLVTWFVGMAWALRSGSLTITNG